MRPKTLSLFSLVLGVGFAVYFSNCWYGDIFFMSFLGAFSFYVGVKKILAVVVVDFFCDVLFFDVETFQTVFSFEPSFFVFDAKTMTFLWWYILGVSACMCMAEVLV